MRSDQTQPSGRHRERPDDAVRQRPAAMISSAYAAAHPGTVRSVGRRDTRAQRAKAQRRAAARVRFAAAAAGRPVPA